MLKSIRTTGLALFGCLGLALVVVSQGDEAQTAPRFPMQAEDAVLKLRVGGGAFPISTTLKVYANGAAVLEYRAGKNPAQEVDAGEFASGTLDEALAAIRDGRLLEYDELRVDAEQRRLAGGVDVSGADAETFLVEFLLERPGVSSADALVRKTIRIRAPESRAKLYPSIPEYRALAKLYQLYFREVRAREASK